MAMTGTNTVYSNFYLSNEIEDQFNSKLDLQQFCTVDRGLEGTPGMVRKINVYSATDGTQDLGLGEGNNKSINVSYTQKEYTIKLAQNRFEYYDEQAMTDPMLIPVGTGRMASDMFNHVNADIYGEYEKAQLILPVSLLDFSAFADAEAMLNVENLEDRTIFAFVCPDDLAAIRKSLKDDFKYVEKFAARGYVGTVAGVNIYTKKDATPGVVYMATKEAVTIFTKKGTEVEQSVGQGRSAADANIRLNSMFARKYYVVALTDASKCVAINKGIEFQLTEDQTVTANKKYYIKDGSGYAQVTPAGSEDPSDEGWYEVKSA